MRRILLIAIASLFLAPQPARAATPSGCAIGAVGMAPVSTTAFVSECTFYSVGPSRFVATNFSPFIVERSTNNGATWTTVYYTEAVGVTTSSLATFAGDLVRVRVLCWNPKESRVCGGTDYLLGTSWLGVVAVVSI